MKWTVTHWGLMIITITVIGELCLSLGAVIGAWAYEYTFNNRAKKKKEKKEKKEKENAPCDNLGLKQQAANLFSPRIILISQLSARMCEPGCVAVENNAKQFIGRGNSPLWVFCQRCVSAAPSALRRLIMSLAAMFLFCTDEVRDANPHKSLKSILKSTL